MKNLKKVVALSLAAVMMFGMMVVGAGATSYKDDADISNKTAVAVMSAIKAIEGSDGSYNPLGNLCRADAAVIAARVALTRGVANNLLAVATTYSDVAADSYYSGAVAWATNTGILAGDGTGKFNPLDDLNGYAFAKMLLCVLGYDAEIEGYVNTPDWAVNINFDAMMAGLLAGLEGVDLSKPLTREQAAQMAFNALNANTVSYTGGMDITIGGVTMTQGATRTEDKTASFGEKKYNLTFVPGTIKADALTDGYWTLDDGITAIAGTEVVAEASIVIEGEQTAQTLTATLKGLKDNTAKINSDAEVVADVLKLTGNGVTLKLWVNTDKEICVIEETHEVYTVVSGVVTNRNGEVTAITVTNGDRYTPAAPNAEPTANNQLFDALLALGVEEKDVLAATKVDGVIVSYAKADVVEGKVAKKSDAEGNTVAFTAGGVDYKNAKYATAYTADLGTNYNIYLDSNGFVLNIVEIEEEKAQQPAPEYIYVLEAGYESVRGTKTYYFAGVTMDGTEVEATYVPHKDQQGNVDFTTFDIEKVEGAANDWATIEKLVAYTEKDGVYTFANATAEIVSNVEIAEGALTLADAYFSANVEFVYLYAKNQQQKIVLNPTTITSVPGVELGTKLIIFTSEDAEKQTIIDRVVVVDSAVAAPVKAPAAPPVNYTEGVYMIKEAITTDSFDYYTIIEDADPSKTVVLGSTTVYVDGVETELFVKQTVAQDGKYSVSTIAAGLYKVELDDNGAVKTIKSLNDASFDTEETTVEVVETGLTVVKVNGKYYVNLNGALVDATDAQVYDIAESEDGVNADIATVYANTKVGDTVSGYVVVETDVETGAAVVTDIVVTVYEMGEEA